MPSAPLIQFARGSSWYHFFPKGEQVQLGLGMRIPRHAGLYFFRAVMYRPAYGPPIRGFIFPETSAAQFMYFFEENVEVGSICLYKNRNAWSNLCFPSNYIVYI